MGNKIITEKDFWMCSNGAMPAQLQGSRSAVKTEAGDKYITVADTATSSCIDFGCTQYMLLAALVIAALAVLAALIVATGGAALIVIGAVAGFAGALLMGVIGALICGHQMRGTRKWIGGKTNLILQGGNAVTGNDKMTCPAGGTIIFAPNITSWSQAIGVAALNYTTIAIEGAFIGAGVAMLAALATGSLVLAVPTLASVGTNLAIMAAMKALSGTTNYVNKNATGQIHSTDDALKAAIPEYEAATRIASGGPVTLGDIILFGSDILLPFLHVKAPVPAVKPPGVPPPPDPVPNAPKQDVPGPPPEVQAAPAQPEIKPPGPGQNGNAFEDPALLDRIGKPSGVWTGEPNTPFARPRELPYQNPPEIQVVTRDNPLDVSKLDPNRTYLWVVDAEGNFIIAPEDQVFPSGRGVVKHGDLVPGPDGGSRGQARLGGEMKAQRDANGNPTGKWTMDDNSSYNFARKDGAQSSQDNVDATKDLLSNSGTDTSQIDTNSVNN